jgi:sodium transport system permease protein
VVQLAAFKLTFFWVAGAESNFFQALDLKALAAILAVALPLMVLAVSMQVVIAAITRSFKEAQTYLGLLPLVPAIPGMVLVFAPVKSQLWMMAIPAFSQTLLFGQALRDETVSWADVATSGGVTGALALLLLYLAARLYEREELVFGRR